MANHRAANALGVAGGAASGALPGFLAGGPVGAGIGALIGGGLAGAQNIVADKQRKKAEKMAKKTLNPKDKKPGSSFWDGEQARTEQLPLHNPEQAAAMKALLPGTVERLGGNQFDFAPIEEKSRRDFQKYTVPSLANRFSAFGGGTSTDAYQNALASAQAEHETGLASLKSEYGLKQQTQQQNMLNTLLQPTHQNLYFPQQPGFGQRFAENLLPQLTGAAIQHGVPALINAGSNYFGNKQQAVPTMPQGTQSTTPTIGAASTPQGQAAQALAQSAQPASVLGGAGANVAKQGGLSTAGKAGLGLAGGAGAYALTQYLSDLLRRG